MNNWQEWVVGVLVVLCIVRLVYGIYTFFRRTRDSGNPCDSCVSGCELKDMMEKKSLCTTSQSAVAKKMQKSEKKIAKYLQIKKKCRTFATAIEKQRLITIRFLG